MKVENYSKLTVEEVKERLDSGRLKPGEVRQLETESGKDRKTIWDLLPEEDISEEAAKVQTREGSQSGPVRVPAGGIDPRLVEQRDKQREAEKDVSFAHASEPAALDPKLAEIREKTREQEAKLANRSLREPPVRTSR